jgi:effector-binding domain-containing protein
MTYTVWIENARRREIAAIAGRATERTIGSEIDLQFARLYQALRSTVGATTGRNVVIYHEQLSLAHAFESNRASPIEVGVECLLPRGEVVGIRPSVTPEGLVATTEHIGPHERLTHAHMAVRGWCRANGWVIAGINWEVYGNRPHDPEQCRTAVYYLLR